MARKSARAIAAAEAASAAAPEEESNGSGTAKVSVSDLSAKSCLTCGRVITPRAKWAKDWPGIKYCSDRCRSTRPGKIVVRFTSTADITALQGLGGVEVVGDELRVDLETFVESVLLDVADNGNATLEDVQQRIVSLLHSAHILTEESRKAKGGDESSEGSGMEDTRGKELHPLWKALDSAPGLRERVRRAARRLALGITHDSDAQQTNITTTDNGRLQLIQAGKLLRTVEDLSFAKGVLHIRRKP